MDFGSVVNSTTIATYLVMSLASAAISSLPAPKNDSSEWYKWAYKFLNTAVANVTALRGKAQFEENMKVDTVTSATLVSRSVGVSEPETKKETP